MKPIFCATHPRACSTAFERVFMTRKDALVCIHEPFGDAFYYGPERLSSRYENDEKARVESGFSNSTYKDILDNFDQEQVEGKRLFIKDMIYYLMPPDRVPARIAPSLEPKKRGIGTSVNGDKANGDHRNGDHKNGDHKNGVKSQPPFPYDTEPEQGNPTLMPESLLKQFHFTFLIRDPHSSVPSYYRCCVPPLDKVTGFYDFYPNEAGYDELVRFFDFLNGVRHIGPKARRTSVTGLLNGDWYETPNDDNEDGVEEYAENAEICVVDADDLLDNPEGIIRAYCESVGLDFRPDMLTWETEQEQTQAAQAFAKWKGFHEDALDSKDLKPRKHKKAAKREEEYDAEWVKKFGTEAAKVIRETVDRNMEDYLYLKKFAIKP